MKAYLAVAVVGGVVAGSAASFVAFYRDSSQHTQVPVIPAAAAAPVIVPSVMVQPAAPAAIPSVAGPRASASTQSSYRQASPTNAVVEPPPAGALPLQAPQSPGAGNKRFAEAMEQIKANQNRQ